MLVLVWLRFDYRILERYKYVFGVSAIVLLMLPSVPGLGQRINGVKLWVEIGPLQFQPGEIAKIFLVIFLAGYLRDKREALAQGRLKDFGPLLADLGRRDARARPDERPRVRAPQLRDLPRDALRRDGARSRSSSPAWRCSPAARPLLYDKLDRVQQRVTVWLEPWTDDKVYCSINGALEYRQNCDSYQLVKSLYSIANGGYGGTGIGKGTFQTVDGTQLIPYLQTDFIYSAIAQELGLIGAAAVLLLFLALVARGMRVALVAQDGFSKLLAAGLSFGFALQTFIIVGGVLRLVPLTGITLPFVSYGGSSIVSNFVMLALLMLVSHRAVRDGADVNRQLTRVGWTAMALIVALIVGTTYWQTWARPGLAARQDNEIQRVAEFQVRRGLILAPERVLARNRVVERRGKKLYFRRYPQGKLTAHVVGYSTASRSRAGLEKSLNGTLTGTERGLADLVDRQLRDLRGKPIVGDTVVTTLDLHAQQVALDELGRTCGAVVALDPRSGQAPRDGLLPELQPEPRREPVLEDLEDHCRLPAGGAARQPRVAGPLPAGIDLQGRHGVGGARVEPLLPRLGVRRPRLLHRLRQAGQQLRHEQSVREALPRHGAPALGELGVLQHRQGARREADPRAGPTSSGSTSGRRSRRRTASATRAGSTGTESSGIRSAIPTSMRGGWRSGRSGCSSPRSRWRWSPAASATQAS